LRQFCSMKILMVCLGNICRSPLAEGILQHKATAAGFGWHIESAGTEIYHVGNPPHPLSQKVALSHGIDIGRQRARRFMAEDFLVFDRIYALAGDVLDEIKLIAGDDYDAKKIDLLMNESFPGKDRDVPDPYFGTEADYHKAFNLIDEACDAIIRNASLNPSQGGTLKINQQPETSNKQPATSNRTT
jgi:protein-tyrosine phosphatase